MNISIPFLFELGGGYENFFNPEGNQVGGFQNANFQKQII
nr:MAG TPA: hypothetical protein [Caudoviricetes sp.]